jgi:hypothetical protein
LIEALHVELEHGVSRKRPPKRRQERNAIRT